MSTSPSDFIAALYQVDIDNNKVSNLLSSIKQAIQRLQEKTTEDTSISESYIKKSIENIGKVSVKLKESWIDHPEQSYKTIIPQKSSVLEVLDNIEAEIVNSLKEVSEYSSSLFEQLRAINNNNAEIRKYIYPKLSFSSGPTKTIIDDMSLTNLKLYSSFLGVALNSTNRKSSWINAQIKSLQVLKKWLEEYQADRLRRNVRTSR